MLGLLFYFINNELKKVYKKRRRLVLMHDIISPFGDIQGLFMLHSHSYCLDNDKQFLQSSV